MAAMRQEAMMAALHETYMDDRTATRFDLAYVSVMTLIIVCTVVNEMLQPPLRLTRLVLVAVFGRLPTAWECVRLLVRQAWQWATLSDMLFHLFVVYLLKPDVTLQIHLRPALAVVLLLCRYTPDIRRFLANRASGALEALFAYLDDTCDDDVWHLSVEGVFRVTKSWLYLPLRILWRSLNWLADLEARGGDTRRVIRMIWWPSSAYAWVVAFRATRRAARLIVWLLTLLLTSSAPPLETQQRLIPSAPTRDGGACFTFTGQPLACDELELARRFNREEMPTLQSASYADVRRAMTEYGLYGSSWHVGHARPDPNKRRTNDDEDRGHNLLAQHATDNMKLGHVQISCAESKFLHAAHVKCR